MTQPLSPEEIARLDTGDDTIISRLARRLLTEMDTHAAVRESFRRFITQAMTYRRVNTEEWVNWFENEAIADAKQALRQPTTTGDGDA